MWLFYGPDGKWKVDDTNGKNKAPYSDTVWAMSVDTGLVLPPTEGSAWICLNGDKFGAEPNLSVSVVRCSSCMCCFGQEVSSKTGWRNDLPCAKQRTMCVTRVCSLTTRSTEHLWSRVHARMSSALFRLSTWIVLLAISFFEMFLFLLSSLWGCSHIAERSCGRLHIYS